MSTYQKKIDSRLRKNKIFGLSRMIKLVDFICHPRNVVSGFLLTLVMNAPTANASDESIYLQVGGFSTHFDDTRSNGQEYNEEHNNIGIEYEAKLNMFDDNLYWGLTAAYMKNSVDYDSALVGAGWKYRWQLDEDWNVAVGGLAGVQNGYPKRNKRDEDEFVPVAYPLAEVNYQRFGVYGTCVPEVYSSGFCFAGFKFRMYDLD
jgi:hypothetical protein